MLTTTLLIAVEEIDPNQVTPGVEGFIATGLFAVVSLLLIIDMVRRMRRVRYREEARQNIDAEEAAAGLIDSVNKQTGNTP
jgi:hypothetical protein